MTTSASWNPFAQNSNKAGIVGSQGREDYEAEDVEYYFNYMGILADEGSNDRMDALLEAGKHPIDVILLFAAAEGDTPKIEEILEAGADPKVTDMDGKTPIDLAGANNPGKKDVVIEMLNALNALSEDSSLLQMPPWANPWLLLGITFPMLLHISVLYEPRLAAIFQLAPLAKDHWRTVAYFSAPLVLLEEMLKLWARCLGNEG